MSIAEPGDLDHHNDREKTIDAIRKSYDFQIGEDGYLYCLISGDMGWCCTDIKITDDAAHVNFARRVIATYEDARTDD